MTLDDATRQLARILEAENAALAVHDLQAAADLLPGKQAAAEALRTALATPGPRRPAHASDAARLQDLATRNAQHLTLALEVQSRILQIVANTARQASQPGYGSKGRLNASGAPQALAIRT